jgi:hypothetical protein
MASVYVIYGVVTSSNNWLQGAQKKSMVVINYITNPIRDKEKKKDTSTLRIVFPTGGSGHTCIGEEVSLHSAEGRLKRC